MQLHKLHKYASELKQSGGRRGRAEAEGVGGSQRWVEMGKGGCTMTILLRFHGIHLGTFCVLFLVVSISLLVLLSISDIYAQLYHMPSMSVVLARQGPQDPSSSPSYYHQH